MVKQDYNAKSRGRGETGASLSLNSGFKEAFKDIAMSGNRQYQYLQLVTSLPEDIQNEMEQTQFPVEKATLLTHRKLRNDPDAQDFVMDQIKDKRVTTKAAAGIVRQAVHDLSTGVLTKIKYGIEKGSTRGN